MYFYLIIVLIILLVTLDRWKPEKFKKIHKLLGCDFLYLPIIGHAHIFFGGERRVRNYVDIARQCYRNKHGMISFWLGNRLFIGISDPVQARIVLKTCLDKGVLSSLTVDVLGNLSAFAPVEEWQPRRKVMGAVLAPRFVKDFVEIFSRHSEDLCDKLSCEALKDDFSIWKHFFNYTFGTITETTIGTVKKTTMNKEHHPVKKAIEESMQNFIKRISRPWLHIETIYKLTGDYKRQIKNKMLIRDFITELISMNKKINKEQNSAPPDNQAPSSNKKTLLELLMEFSGGDNGYVDAELLEELVLLIIASTDTTTLSAGFICVLLSLYPEIQEKAYKEARNFFEDFNRKINLEDLKKLEYIEAIIKEVIRLYPSGPIILRQSNADLMLPTGFTIEKDTAFLINIFGINRHPHYWGGDAEEFRPERFLEGAPSHPAAFMSFSYGPRNCAGQNFAMVSLKILFLHILRRYRITPTRCYENAKEVKYSVDIMLRPINGFKVKIEPRS